jgi:ParB family chromosome partitioning protein
MEKRRLGRGLDALIGSIDQSESIATLEPSSVPIERIQPNPRQPRKSFDPDELSSLGQSIRNHGILQPLVVRAVGDTYELIAGERRLRAAQAAGFTEVPVRIVDFNDQQVLEAALVENIQRSDLNPIEKAQGFRDYLDRFRMTQEQLAQRLGLDRSTISNLVNLLDLAAEVQEAVRLGQISLGHAKVIKGIVDRERQVALCREIIARGHSVRATEGIARNGHSEPSKNGERAKPEKSNHLMAIEDELRRLVGTRLEIRLRDADRGEIVLRFDSNEDFERLVDLIRAGGANYTCRGLG